MGLMERAKNLLATDLGTLRNGEGVSQQMRRYLQDLEWTHRGLSEAARQACVTRTFLETRLEKGAEALDLWTRRAELTLRRQEEALARIALMKKVAAMSTLSRVERQIGEVAREERELADQVSQLRQRILATRYLRRMPTADNYASADASGAPDMLFQEVEKELVQLKERCRKERDGAAPTPGESDGSTL